MIKQLIIVSQTSFLILLFLSQFCYGQKTIENKFDFIRVYSSQSYQRPPFETKQIEISNNQICNRILLPPRNRMRPQFLEKYDSMDTTLKCQVMRPVDYDSIVNYILNSGLLNIDLNYTKPDTTDGIVGNNMGGGSYFYIVETSNGKLNLSILDARVFTVPDILRNFDKLFKRISRRYY